MKTIILGFLIAGIILASVVIYDVITSKTVDNDLDNELIVYETEVASADECSSFEQYNADTQVCYFECTNTNECNEILIEIDAELESWTNTLEDQNRSFSEDVSSEENFLAAYSVTENEKIELINGNPSNEYKDLWKEIAELSPDSLSNDFIEQFAVYNDESSDTLAYVIDEDANGKWLIAINLATHNITSVREQKSTIIHELAHILTLNSSQIVQDFISCNTFEISEGCAKETSYLYKFYDNFWKNSQNQTYNPSDFVTEYATTNTEEDLAESFAFFVLENNFTNSTMRNQKVNFFNQYQELKTIRSDMRKVLTKEIVRERKIQ